MKEEYCILKFKSCVHAIVIVSVPPMIWVQNQLVGAQEGQKLTLECYSEAFPKSINYWTRDQDKIVPQGEHLFPININTNNTKFKHL